MTRVQLGAMGEALAVDYLTEVAGLVDLWNRRCRYGELDVIACDAATARCSSSRHRTGGYRGSRTR